MRSFYGIEIKTVYLIQLFAFFGVNLVSALGVLGLLAFHLYLKLRGGLSTYDYLT